jgi:nucleoside-triphosphatase THEP1/DNA-binding NarL/FixJ family response regulator
MATDPQNTYFELALQYVNFTDRNIFLTGRAGTGKTTFLRHIRDDAFKKIAVVAPTGVAAINAGGQTIHSFFQIAPGLFLPGHTHGWGRIDHTVLNVQSLLRNVRLTPQKRETIEKLELLIVDEVSMVRADTMDAIDTVLRHVRQQPKRPFGGVQVLLIGDLFQLPPVTRHDEWELMKQYYKSPFFFDALVMKESPPVCLELQKIYRQSDDRFIQLLNAVRNSEAGPKELYALNEHYVPDFVPPENEFYITLTTHNSRADRINHKALAELPGKLEFFNADIEGDFPEKSYPAEQNLSLKPSAQVMFIKNDKGEFRRYYNGKLATISRIDEDKKIFVRFTDDPEELELELETWRNIRYKFNKEKDRIEEEELGAFKQYPIRLAWAITIHKSQGLTFEKAIIDAGESFSPGQVYVALSRMTSLSGMILKSKILSNSIQTDDRVLAFSQRQLPLEDLKEDILLERETFVKKTILLAFDFDDLIKTFKINKDGKIDSLNDEEPKSSEWLSSMAKKLEEQREIAQKFSTTLMVLLVSDGRNRYNTLLERCEAAVRYFKGHLIDWLNLTVSEIHAYRLQKKGKKHLALLRDIESQLEKKERLLTQSLELSQGLAAGKSIELLLEMAVAQHRPTIMAKEEEIPDLTITNEKIKEKKEASSDTSLKLFRSGHSVSDIANKRNLTLSTVFSHLSAHITTGEIHIHQIVPEQKTNIIIKALASANIPGFKSIKDMLGNDFSYDEIRAVAAFRKYETEPSIKKNNRS